ncbi:MAG: bifunctional folylpolyglutamate synthase/dihydrofolate synthase, partial [Chloroflexi bacterium]|nr:bifunctional folylpolyglutamate synthase/dihydrofolate synthase [Chloroflexota bacterium]
YVHWPGRLEVVRESPLVVLDGAHNTYSATRLAEAVREDLPHKPVYLVLGTSTDKDIQGIARELAPVVAGAFAVSSRHPRSLPAVRVADALWESGVRVRPEPSVAAGVEKAMAEAGARGIVLVTGSLFVVAEAREHILGITPELYPG